MKRLAYWLVQRAGRVAPERFWPVAAVALVGQLALAQIGASLSSEFSNAICPVVRFLAGPLAWAAIAAGLVIGVATLALGGRGAVRWMIGAFAAAVLLLVGKGYVENNAQGLTSCFK